MSQCDDIDKTELNAEVLWCSRHLEDMMASGKLSEKKTKEARTCYKVIRNPETALPKLRQAMRKGCGDYKAKMKAEEKEVKLDSNKILSASVERAQCNFIKKSSVASVTKKEESSSSEKFKFNFNIQT